MRNAMPLGSTVTHPTAETDLKTQEWPIDEISRSHWPLHSWEHDDVEDFLRNHQPDHLDQVDASDTDWDMVQIDDILGCEDAHVHHLEALGLDD